MTQQPDFIDVSHWQGAIDWDAVARSGIVGAIAKCTDGKAGFDAEYLANRAGALANELAFCPYHYLQKGDGAGQMAWFLSKAQLRQGERVVIDYEEDSPSVDMATLKDAVTKLRADRPDLQITIYGASKLTDDVNKLTDTSWLAETSLWAARYSDNQPTVGKAWVYWSAWQFSDCGEIAGIDGDVDLNTFNGDQLACVGWFGPVAEVPIPEPVPETVAVAQILRAYGREVAVHIDADGMVSFWVDGEPWSG